MFKVQCFTNLDLHPQEAWPDELEFMPRVGDCIESSFKWLKQGERIPFQLTLQVCSITYVCREIFTQPGRKIWLPRIELHMTDWQKRFPAPEGRPEEEKGTIRAFYEWYTRHTKGTVVTFL